MLTPKRLELINCGVHSEAIMEYVPGITGVLGANGTGKTILSHIAPMYAITGILIPDYRKEDLLKKGTTNGHIKFTFECNNITYVVTRSLKGSKVELEWCEGSEKHKLKKAAVVNQKMEELLEIPLKIFSEICFIPQGEVNALITMDHASRMKLFQKLTNTLKADTLRTLIQLKINSLEIFNITEAEINNIEKDLKYTETKISEKEKALKDHEKVIEKLKNKQDIIEKQLKLPLQSDIEDKVKNVGEYLQRTKKDKKELLRVNDIEEKVPECFISKEDLTAYTNYKKYIESAEALRKIKQRSVYLKTTITIPEDMSEEINTIKKDIANKSAELNALQKEQALVKSGKCPTCSQVYEGASLESLELEEKNIKEELQMLKNSRDNVQKAQFLRDDTLKRLNAELLTLNTKEEMYEKIVKDLPVDCKHFNEEAFIKKQQQADLYKNYTERRAKIIKQLQQLDKDINKYQNQIDVFKATKTITTEQQQAARVCKKVYSEADTQCKIIKSELDLLKESRDYKNKLKEENSSKLRKNEINKQVKIFLEKAQDLLHREKLPRMVMEIIRESLNELIALHLKRFNVPFTAYLDEQFDLYYDKLDWEKAPARTLSGGQKAALSLSCIIAIAEMFNTPMLALDEPTYGFDTEHMQDLVNVFQILKKYAEENTFITLVTHDEGLIPVCTSIIRTK